MIQFMMLEHRLIGDKYSVIIHGSIHFLFFVEAVSLSVTVFIGQRIKATRIQLALIISKVPVVMLKEDKLTNWVLLLCQLQITRHLFKVSVTSYHIDSCRRCWNSTFRSAKCNQCSCVLCARAAHLEQSISFIASPLA